MAEVAGLVVGVVALAGLFNKTLDCFQYIQLGRNFGKNFQTSQLRLDNAKLRLSRWGKALELDGDVQRMTSLQDKFESEEVVRQSEALLGQILELFADAEGASVKYKNRASAQDGSLAVYDLQSDLEPTISRLHDKMKKLALQRQNRTGLRQKAKWALYQEKHFRRLIEDIVELVDDLVELFPATEQIQRQLCVEEVSEIGKGEGISMLKEIAASQDKMLEEAIGNATAGGGTTYNISITGENRGGNQVAHNAGTITMSVSGFRYGRDG